MDIVKYSTFGGIASFSKKTELRYIDGASDSQHKLFTWPTYKKAGVWSIVMERGGRGIETKIDEQAAKAEDRIKWRNLREKTSIYSISNKK